MWLTDLGMGRRTILAMASCSSERLSIDSTGGGDTRIQESGMVVFKWADRCFGGRATTGRYRVLRHMVHYWMGRDLKFVYGGKRMDTFHNRWRRSHNAEPMAIQKGVSGKSTLERRPNARCILFPRHEPQAKTCTANSEVCVGTLARPYRDDGAESAVVGGRGWCFGRFVSSALQTLASPFHCFPAFALCCASTFL